MYIHTYRNDTLAWTTIMFLPPEHAITFLDNLVSASALRNVNHKIFTVLCPLAFPKYPWTPPHPIVPHLFQCEEQLLWNVVLRMDNRRRAISKSKHDQIIQRLTYLEYEPSSCYLQTILATVVWQIAFSSLSKPRNSKFGTIYKHKNCFFALGSATGEHWGNRAEPPTVPAL